MHKKMSKTLALISGLVLLLTGLVAFIPNPVAGHGALLARFAPRPLVPGGLDVLLVLVSPGGARTAASGLYALGAVSLLTALTAVAADSQIDRSGILFVALLGVLLLLFGKMNTARKQLMFD